MNINYHAPFEINPYMKNLFEEKFQKIENLNVRYTDADVFFKLNEGTSDLEKREIELKLLVPGHVLFASSHAETYEQAIPEVVDKLRKQVIKYKESLEPKRTGR